MHGEECAFSRGSESLAHVSWGHVVFKALFCLLLCCLKVLFTLECGNRRVLQLFHGYPLLSLYLPTQFIVTGFVVRSYIFMILIIAVEIF